MSYYYNYYIGYKKDNKIYPWGIYTSDGERCPVISRSRSFASDLHNKFYPISEKMISDELRKEFEYKNWNNEMIFDVKYLPVSELPSTNFIEKGYFLINEVEAYELSDEESFWFDGFSSKLSPQIYAAKLEHQLKFGENKPKKNDEGYEYTEPNASDYMWYVYPNYNSEEYESFLLHEFVNAIENYRLSNTEYVILETEG